MCSYKLHLLCQVVNIVLWNLQKMFSFFLFLNKIIYCRAKEHPSPSLDMYCTRMSIRLSEDHKWESIRCSEASAAVAACQYQFKVVDTSEISGRQGNL